MAETTIDTNNLANLGADILKAKEDSLDFSDMLSDIATKDIEEKIDLNLETAPNDDSFADKFNSKINSLVESDKETASNIFDIVSSDGFTQKAFDTSVNALGNGLNNLDETVREYSENTTNEPLKFLDDIYRLPARANDWASNAISETATNIWNESSDWISGLNSSFEDENTSAYLAESSAIATYEIGKELALAAIPLAGGIKNLYKLADPKIIDDVNSLMVKYDNGRSNALNTPINLDTFTRNRPEYLGRPNSSGELKEMLFSMQKTPSYLMFGNDLDVSPYKLFQTLTLLGDKKFGNNQLFEAQQFQFNKTPPGAFQFSEPTGTFSPLIISTTGHSSRDFASVLPDISTDIGAPIKTIFNNIPSLDNKYIAKHNYGNTYNPFDNPNNVYLIQANTYTGQLDNYSKPIITKHPYSGTPSTIFSDEEISFTDLYFNND